MRSLRAALSPFHRSRGRLLLAALLLVVALGLLATGLGGLMFAKESDPPTTNEGTLAPPRNGLDTPTATPIPTQPPSSAPAVRMIIEKIGLDAPVITLGLDENGIPQVPENADDVVWYDFSGKPGWGSNAVFSGHYDWTVNRQPVTGVFYELGKVEVGDIIKVKLADGTDYRYRVIDNLTTPDGDPQLLEFIAATPADMATLITCGLLWTPDLTPAPGTRYWARQVVRAELIREAGAASTGEGQIGEPGQGDSPG